MQYDLQGNSAIFYSIGPRLNILQKLGSKLDPINRFPSKCFYRFFSANPCTEFSPRLPGVKVTKLFIVLMSVSVEKLTGSFVNVKCLMDDSFPL
jgi:hypothetical protein